MRIGLQWPSWILVVLCATACPAKASDLDLDALARKVRPAVLLVIACDARGLEVAYGTAFLVSKDGKLITNRHVIQGRASAFARTMNGRRHRVLGVLAEDPEHDLVLLKIEANELPSLALGSSKSAKTGLPVAIIGNPGGEPGVALTGKVARVDELLGEPGWMQIEAAIQPGSSGSPALNAQGEVIGIIEASLSRARPLGLAMPVEVARRLLARAASEPKPFSSLRGKSEEYALLDTDFTAAASAVLEKDLEEAQKRVDLALQRHPHSAAVHLLKGQIAEERGAFDQAHESFQKAAQCKPDSAEAWYCLGSACLRLKKYEEARGALEQATKIRAHYPLAWSRLGEACRRLGQHRRAVDAYREVTKLTPDDEQAWTQLASAYSTTGQPDRALDALREAVRLQPDSADLWRRLGAAYSLKHDYRPAADAFERSIQLKADDVSTWWHLGSVYAESGEREKLERVIEKVRKLAPDYAPEFEKQMRQLAK